ncbi:hypothetical protein BDZ97DRAFT_482808 [Flammula alnicola]|nr:hypothetical protein BDZ97DRAFT_482808 [Flammula alnicola]
MINKEASAGCFRASFSSWTHTVATSRLEESVNVELLLGFLAPSSKEILTHRTLPWRHALLLRISAAREYQYHTYWMS